MRVWTSGGDLLEVGVAEDGFAQGCVEGFGGEGAEVFAVEPLELGEVEDGAAEADVFDVEAGDHVGEGEDVGFAGFGRGLRAVVASVSVRACRRP